MSHEMTESEIRKHVRVYMMVFGALGFLTIVTVAVSYLDVNIYLAVAIALLIAIIKGSLVACYFMHLIDERKLIYWTLLLTVAFFIGLLFLPTFGLLDQVRQVVE